MTENVIIIGGGPAALTAALYTARANLSPLVLEGEPLGTMLPGGQLMITTEVENFPGFPEGVTGPELVARMQAQVDRFGVRRVMEMVESVDFGQYPFRLRTSAGRELSAKSVIVATGSTARWLGVPGERELASIGGGVSACCVCDSFMARGKVGAVIGGGDTAAEEVLYLSRHASKSYLIHRRDSLRASKIMAERVLSHPNIEVLWNKVVVEVLGEREITGVILEDTVTGSRSELALGAMFVAIGHTPNTAFLKGQLELHDNGYIKTVAGWNTATKIPGVFAAGDVMDSQYRQAISSCGSGCIAALQVERWLAARD